jgi:hypothetical protein
MKALQLPPEVLRALEAVERATSPTDIGSDYQILLNWQRQNPTPLLSRNLINMLPALIAMAIGAMLVAYTDFVLTEFSRGALFGAMIAGIIYSIADAIRKRDATPVSTRERVQSAVDRWRSMVPAMRELPR